MSPKQAGWTYHRFNGQHGGWEQQRGAFMYIVCREKKRGGRKWFAFIINTAASMMATVHQSEHATRDGAMQHLDRLPRLAA